MHIYLEGCLPSWTRVWWA